MTNRPDDSIAVGAGSHELGDAVGTWMAAVGAGRRNVVFVLLIGGAIILALLATTIENTLTRSLDGAARVLVQPPSLSPR
jgi:hypothetical protein